MTENEAKRYGEDYLKDLTCAVCKVADRHKDFVRMSIKALEKQIPKKIVKHDKCPVCNNGQSTTWYYVGASYCEYCGQKLSWESDTD